MKCDTCKHRKWIMLKQAGAHWTIMGCLVKRLRFGRESDLHLTKSNLPDGCVPMPKNCKEFEKWL